MTAAGSSAYQDAIASAKGVASFASADFDVSSGAVTIKANGVSDAQVVDALTISGGTVDNSVIGGTAAAEARVTSLGFAGFAAASGSAAPSAKDVVFISGVGEISKVANSDDDAANICGVLEANSSGSANGKLVMQGPVSVACGSESISAGDALYLSSTAGQVTKAAPTSGWVVRVGFAYGASSSGAVT